MPQGAAFDSKISALSCCGQMLGEAVETAVLVFIQATPMPALILEAVMSTGLQAGDWSEIPPISLLTGYLLMPAPD
jgi:hypothetical protein